MTTSAADTLTLEYLKTIGIVNNQPLGRGFANPVDLALHPDGRIFVLNRGPGLTRIGVANFDEDYLYEFAGAGDGDGKFKLAAGVALDSAGILYVTDEFLHRIIIFNADNGEFIRSWGTHGSEDGELNAPSGIAFDTDDNMYIADQNNHRIQKLTTEGRFIGTWGSFGSGDGEFNMPWGVCAAPDGCVYVADWRNDRIQKFTQDGEFLAAFGESGGGDGQLSRPAGVAVDSSGNMIVADWGNERIQTFASDGRHIATLRGEATLSKWAQDFLAANPDEVETRKISDLMPELPPHLNTPYLISSQTEPYFWGPASVNLDAEGRMFVTESSRHRIQVYQCR